MIKQNQRSEHKNIILYIKKPNGFNNRINVTEEKASEPKTEQHKSSNLKTIERNYFLMIKARAPVGQYKN